MGCLFHAKVQSLQIEQLLCSVAELLWSVRTQACCATLLDGFGLFDLRPAQVWSTQDLDERNGIRQRAAALLLATRRRVSQAIDR